ncbi:polysaccharide lyase [Vreelandella malpeensis]|uniref:Polysaccharide lyase 14 domain-containing protein n=1 Tax=Vreelandella malpeensis TaxID=1172368 RepID=A0ABS8DT95_9GAMM|nr:hypothetical protein [Halomonas malpeensis]MCB8889547.1 hypothetical protein [Halomonas malpeensis]
MLYSCCFDLAALGYASTFTTVIDENFDSSSLSTQGEALLAHPLVHPSSGRGVKARQKFRLITKATNVVVAGWSKPPRILPAEQYELAFWVRFCEEFDFARGGKLHGLGHASPVTGGNEITAKGWSARLMFRRDGGVKTYVYHQDMVGVLVIGKWLKTLLSNQGNTII